MYNITTNIIAVKKYKNILYTDTPVFTFNYRWVPMQHGQSPLAITINDSQIIQFVHNTRTSLADFT